MLRKLLAAYDRVAPRPADVVASVAGAAVALLPLAALRLWVAGQMTANPRTIDLWRIQLAEIECWSVTAVVGMVLLRLSRHHRLVRVGFHAWCTLFLLLSIVELVFVSVMGSRADWDLLLFALRDAAEMLPVAASEIRWYHLAGLALGVAVGFAPAALRGTSLASPWWGRLSPLLLVPALWLEVEGRRQPKRDLKPLVPSLIEVMWFDGLDHLGNPVVPPAPGETDSLLLDWAPGAPRPNVVLILLESTGAQVTTLHNPKLPTTPNLVALAEKGLHAKTAYAVVPHTSKAIVTTMCGTWPKLVSEIREAAPGGLPGRCLPDLLEEAGYRTAFFQTAFEKFESRQDLVHFMGFDLFRSRDTLSRKPYATVNYFGLEDRAMTEPGLAWSTQEPGRPFFATYLTLTSHHDYGTPPDWEKVDFPDAKGRREQYLNAVRYVDAFVGELVAAYEARGLAENTLFVIQGDHGEAFNQHGRSYHDLVIWDEGLKVPLVLYGPKVLGGRTGVLDGPRQQIDVVPTILDVLGARVRRGSLPGASLLADVPEDRELRHSCWRSYRCLATRQGTTKFIDHYREMDPQRFDLADDPGEKRPVAMDAEEEARRIADARAWRARVNGRYEALHAMYLERIQRPDASTPAVASWGEGKVEGLGCEATTPEVVPGEAAWIRCRWRAAEEISMAWRLHARLEGNFETVDANVHPVGGQLPTFKWRPGWVVEDELRVSVPMEADPGPATLSLGWRRFAGDDVPRDGGGGSYAAVTLEVVARDWERVAENGAPKE
ncbi:MAG: LTA synthase family protein [Myxococcota bacterium]